MTGATAIEERALGPDLTRGLMLWFIALANSHYFLDAPRVLGGYPHDVGALDRATTWVLSTFVDGRAFPLFGLLFGYGVAQVVRRHGSRGRKGVRRLLWRRAGALVAIGFTHAILLYIGDILAAYGVLLAFGAWTVFWGDRWLLGWAAFFFLLTALPDAAALHDAREGPMAAELPADPGEAVVERLPVQPCYLAQSIVWAIVFTPFLLGLAGRLTVTTTALLATATWLTTVVVAARLARAGRRGPFELLLRRATYRPPGYGAVVDNVNVSVFE